jgi:hypothetical protein
MRNSEITHFSQPKKTPRALAWQLHSHQAQVESMTIAAQLQDLHDRIVDAWNVVPDTCHGFYMVF